MTSSTLYFLVILLQFVLLGNNLLDLSTKFFPICMRYGFGDFVTRIFDQDGMKSLAQMVCAIDCNADELSMKEDMCYYFRNYLMMLYSCKVLDQDKMVRHFTCICRNFYLEKGVR